MVVGDFNFNFVKTKILPLNKLFVLFNIFRLCQLIKTPTYVTNTCKSTIDLIFNNIGKTLINSAGAVDVAVSDHIPIYVNRKAGHQKRRKNVVNRQNYALCDKENIQ